MAVAGPGLTVSYVPSLATYLPTTAATTNLFVSPAAALPAYPNGSANAVSITYAINNTLFYTPPLRVTAVARPSELIMIANGAQVPAFNNNCSFTFYNLPYMGLNSGTTAGINLNAPAIPPPPTWTLPRARVTSVTFRRRIRR